jgi:two-component system response regulator DegU
MCGLFRRKFIYSFNWPRRHTWPSRESMTILIVEDNPELRRLLRNVVVHFAEQVWECSDGADALAAFEEHSPEVVLMDVRMPRQDGLVSTRQIRRLHPEARVIIITDYDDDELRKAASDAGAAGYLLKQDMTQLRQQIEDVMQSSPGPTTDLLSD